MCLNPRQVARKDIYGSWHIVVVSCGHCWECVRKRQNEMAALVVRESEYRGALAHATLTYSPEHLPMCFVRTFYDIESGEFVGSSSPIRISRSVDLFDKSTNYLLLNRADKEFVRSLPRSRKFRASALSLLHAVNDDQDIVNDLGRKRSTLTLREDLIRDRYISRYGRRECRKSLVVDVSLSSDGKCLVYTEVFPSLCRKDVSLYLKRMRVAYEREHGEKLPKFTYNVIGEYGPKRGRPHMHMCVCASDKDLKTVIDYLFGHQSPWHKYVGNVRVKRVQRYTKGKSNQDGFEAAGKYIGKYLAKGQQFEEENVIRGFVERPRRCCSANFGVGDLSALKRYYLCQDLFGDYDVQDVSSYPKDKSALVSWVINRMSMQINGHRYPIPRRIKQLIYYKDVYKTPRRTSSNKCTSFVLCPSSEEISSVETYGPLSGQRFEVVKRSSFLSRLVSSRLQEDATFDYLSKLRSFTGKPLEKTSYLDRLAFENSLSLAAGERSNSIAASQHKFLKKSAF